MSSVNGVDRAKFKKCNDSSFCKRHRYIDPNIAPFDYLIDEKSIDVKGNKLRAEIVEKVSNMKFSLEMKLYDQNIIRLTIDEKSSETGFERYHVEHVVMEDDLKEKNWKRYDPKSHTLFTDEGFVIFDLKMKIDFYFNGEPAVSLNEKGLFYMEHFRLKQNQIENQVQNESEKEDKNQNEAEREDKSQNEEFGPDGNKIVHSEGQDDPQLYGVEIPSIDQDSYGTTERFVMDMEGSWEESYGGHTDSKKRGPESFGIDFTFHNSENVYGLPEHAIDFDLPATKGYQINRDPYRLYNLDVFEYELDSEMALYGAVPLIYSHDPSKTVAVFWLNAAETWIDIEKFGLAKKQGVIGNILNAIGKDNSEKKSVVSHFMSESGVLDTFIMMGSDPKSVIKQYKTITGGAQLPPLFSIAYHQCRWNYKSQEDVASVNQGFEDNSIPVDVIWLDIEHTDGKKYFTWDNNHFSKPQEMQDNLASYGRKMVTIIDPHIKRDSEYSIHNTASSLDYYVKNSHGSDYEGHCWPGSSSYLDFLNPKVRYWWASLYDYDSYKGSTPNLYTWNDMNEPSVFSGPEITMQKDSIHFGNIEHRHIHNQYGQLMHISTFNGQLTRNPQQNLRPFVLTRSFFAGSQRYSAVWTGDNSADWKHLEASIPMLLSLGMGGITFCGADVGGFFKDAPADLMTRWYQTGAWYPFFRAHGHIDTKRREPWIYGEPYLSIMRQAIRTRYMFLPYFYTQFYYAHKNLYPIMRPLWIEYPQDSNTFSIQNQFLIGSDILVHPVTSKDVTTVDIFLPGGSQQIWYSYPDLKPYTASRTITVETPLDYIPVFFRAGSILPLKETMRRSSQQMKNDPYSLFVILDLSKSSTGQLYIDDGESYQYENSKFELLNFSYTPINSKLHMLESKYSKESGILDSSNSISKIIIIGLPTAPSIIKLVPSQEIEFEFIKSDMKLILRKPIEKINSQWSIKIEWF